MFYIILYVYCLSVCELSPCSRNALFRDVCLCLQVVTNRETQETLLCIAFVFEVSTSEHGAQYHVYRLVKD